MSKPTQGDLSELAALVAGAARVGVADAGKLRRAGETLRDACRSEAVAAPASAISELQQAFQAISRHVLGLRVQTDRLGSITRMLQETACKKPDSDGYRRRS